MLLLVRMDKFLYRNPSKMSPSKKLTCKGTLRQLFIRILDWRYSRYFLPSFVNCCPPNLLSDLSLPPSLYKYVCCTQIQFVRGRGVWGSGPQTDKHLPQSPLKVNFFTWPHFALPSMSYVSALVRQDLATWRKNEEDKTVTSSFSEISRYQQGIGWAFSTSRLLDRY